MPETARDMALKVGRDPSRLNLEDPEVNIHMGGHYLSLLFAEFGNDRTATLAAYNAGPSNARAWRGEKLLNVKDIPFPETRDFVGRVQSLCLWLNRFQRVKRVFHV